MSFIDKAMNEVIIFGGLPVTRANVYRIVLADLGERKAADYCAFSPAYPVAPVGTRPLSIDEFREVTA